MGISEERHLPGPLNVRQDVTKRNALIYVTTLLFTLING